MSLLGSIGEAVGGIFGGPIGGIVGGIAADGLEKIFSEGDLDKIVGDVWKIFDPLLPENLISPIRGSFNRSPIAPQPPLPQFQQITGARYCPARSSEDILIDKMGAIDDQIDKLTQEIGTLDLSTKEGQQRLAQINAQIQKLERMTTLIDKMLQAMHDMKKDIIQNLRA